MGIRNLAFVALLVASASGLPESKLLFGSKDPEPRWNSLKVTFLGKDTLPLIGGGKSFDDLPRTTVEASAAKWHEISNKDCTNGGAYNGFRYMLEDDSSLTLLYDTQGTVAGIQMNILKSDVLKPENRFNFDNVSMFRSDNINGKDVFTTTAYFVHPDTICSSGRSASDLKTHGTGTHLYLQNGRTPKDLIDVPMKRKDAIADGWSKNNCFALMGYHNFYRSEDFGKNDCTEYRPSFLLFDKEDGDLVGFGLTATGHATSAKSRFEYPPAAAIKMIVGSDVAQCLVDQANTVGMTTMHVYFTDDYKKRCTIFD